LDLSKQKAPSPLRSAGALQKEPTHERIQSCGVYVIVTKASQSNRRQTDAAPARSRRWNYQFLRSFAKNLREEIERTTCWHARCDWALLSSVHTYEEKGLIMKKIISVSLGTLVLLGAVSFGGFTSSAMAGERNDRKQEANWRRHRRHHHRKHHWRRVPGAASLRKQSY
jgi:hypothetical protein